MVPVRDPVYAGYFADPFLTRFDGRYVAYGSGDPDRGTGDAATFEALVSDDRQSWTSVGSVLTPVDPSLGRDYWAPEVVREDGSYWMYYSVGHGIAGHHIRVARSDSPLGPFIDEGVDLTPGESFAIDAHPFKDEDGSWYLYFARDVLDRERPGTHLAVVRMTSMTTVDATVVPVLAPDSDWQIFARERPMYGTILDWHTLEGPTVIRALDRYYLLFSGGSWEGAGYGVSYATAPHPLGPWTHRAAPEADVLSSSITGLTGPGHNSLLREADGTVRIAYHAWDADLTARRMFIGELRWEGDAPVLADRSGSVAGADQSGRRHQLSQVSEHAVVEEELRLDVGSTPHGEHPHLSGKQVDEHPIGLRFGRDDVGQH